jgi:2,4-dienoyl-CoA reductase (NADPH2)
LADAGWVEKAKLQKEELINKCIACNQACLDHVFYKKTASCLVNPQAGRELDLIIEVTDLKKRIAVVGGGPAGLAFAKTAAERGHQITLYEANAELGGQFNLAKKIPGKQEYQLTIDYYAAQLKKLQVEVYLNSRPTTITLADFDEVVFATGVKPRIPEISGINHSHVMTYAEAIRGDKVVGERVAVIGAGGIGVDVTNWLIGEPHNFYTHWGIDLSVKHPGGLMDNQKQAKHNRKIYLLQRKKQSIGAKLGKTTGWIHRLEIKKAGVTLLSGIHYDKIINAGLIVNLNHEPIVLAVDSIILCAGQQEEHDLYHQLHALGQSVHLIGGAFKAHELDAKQAIEQATRLAALI